MVVGIDSDELQFEKKKEEIMDEITDAPEAAEGEPVDDLRVLRTRYECVTLVKAIKRLPGKVSRDWG